MKLPLVVIMSSLPVVAPLSAQTAPTPRERILLTEDWRFQKGDPDGVGDGLSYGRLKPWLLPSANAFVSGGGASRPAGDEPGRGISFAQPGFDDSSWRRLDLPHDWGIEGPFDQSLPGETGKLPWFGVAWYRKTFDLPAGDAGRQIFLAVDGAMSRSAVWCNGRFVGGWPYGYASWQLDLTPYVKFGGENTLAIRLDNPDASSRWYPGGGIYRNVWLLKSSPVHVAQWGTRVTTPEVTAEKATVAVRVDIANRSSGPAEIRCVNRIFAAGRDGRPEGKPLAEAPGGRFSIPAGAAKALDERIQLQAPQLWSPDHPALYVLLTELEQDGRLVDRYETPFGVRQAEFTVDDGFHLNGKRVPLQGVCLHHDLGALGAAFNTRAAQRQLEILKEMGVNAIRTAHNPPAPELLDLCDRMGFLVMVESFDCWAEGKRDNDYHVLFPDWSEADVRSMVRHARNHPSVVIWSVGNEIPEQGGREGLRIGGALVRFARMEDSTRPVTIGVNAIEGGFNGFQNVADVFGYNYKPHKYEEFRRKNPRIPLYGSETSSTVSSRGSYVFPVNVADQNGGLSDFQVSSYDFSFPEWASLPDTEFGAHEENRFVAGEFVWTGFDYLGEPTPYNADSTLLLNYHTSEDRARAKEQLKQLGKIQVPSRSSYFGIVDLAGFRKDRFFLYQARWCPDLPMAHVLPHWTWPGRAGEITPVYVYTSGDEAELFLNGKSLGRKKKASREYRLHWDDVRYEPGELKVVASRDGKPWATDIVRTAGPAAKISLTVDRSAIRADGRDLAFVTARILDKDGNPVPHAKPELNFTLSGPGEIAATDNGDPTDHTVFSSTRRTAFNGLALAIVRAGKEAGEITVTVRAAGLEPAEARIKTVSNSTP